MSDQNKLFTPRRQEDFEARGWKVIGKPPYKDAPFYALLYVHPQCQVRLSGHNVTMIERFKDAALAAKTKEPRLIVMENLHRQSVDAIMTAVDRPTHCEFHCVGHGAEEALGKLLKFHPDFFGVVIKYPKGGELFPWPPEKP